jgi:site-specific recombinase XerC
MAGKINLKPTTWARYENALTVHVFPRWATVPFTAVEHGQIQAWLAELTASGQSGASVRKLHSVLSAVLELAVRDKRISANPARGVNLPRANTRRRRYLDAGRVELLAIEAGTPPSGRADTARAATYRANELAVFVLAYCGLRRSELAALRVEHWTCCAAGSTLGRQSLRSTAEGWPGAYRSPTRHDWCRCRGSSSRN